MRCESDTDITLLAVYILFAMAMIITTSVMSYHWGFFEGSTQQLVNVLQQAKH